ncbi:MAG: MAPEG family protein [Rhodocyclales bacterium]|nr:MAPEG family protein [Rhodocyclales bacterium]
MAQDSIFLPVLALVGWTLLVLLLIPYRRFRALFAGRVTAEDFRCGESDAVPADVRQPNRMFMNLLEMPVLFYLLALILYITGNVDAFAVVLGWIYFALRVAHSLISLTYNHVFQRFLVFAFSNIVVLILWLRTIPLFIH